MWEGRTLLKGEGCITQPHELGNGCESDATSYCGLGFWYHGWMLSTIRSKKVWWAS
jgi:hypothetical protein